MSPQRRVRTTGDLLVRIGVCLLILTVLAAGFGWLSYAKAYDTADIARTRSVPAILATTAAREAVIKADRAAVISFETGEMRLAGPGDEYRNQIAIVNQNLAKAAEDNVAGPTGSRTLGLVQGQLLSYMTSIESAASIFREDSKAALWGADLRYASGLLHAQSTGVIAQLDELRQLQRAELDRQVASGTTSTLGLLLWLVPAVALVVLLAATQWLLARRFRRRINPFLLLATVVAGLLIGIGQLIFHTEDNLSRASTEADAAVAASIKTASAADADGQLRLAELLGSTLCGSKAEDCGYSMERFFDGLPKKSDYDEGKAADPVHTVRANAELSSATARQELQVFVPLSALVVAAFVVFGLYPRINEYRPNV